MSESTKLHAKDDDLLAGAIDISSLEDDDASDAADPDDNLEIELDGGDDSGEESTRRIQSFGQQVRHAAKWKRQPNVTGQGAMHVKTFVCKLRLDAIENLDEQINTWLDDNPEYEVKFVTTSHGILTGKTKEEAMFVSVWV